MVSQSEPPLEQPDSRPQSIELQLNLCHARQLIIHLKINIVDLSPDVRRQPWLLPRCARSAGGSCGHARATRGSVFHAVIIAVTCASPLFRTKHTRCAVQHSTRRAAQRSVCSQSFLTFIWREVT